MAESGKALACYAKVGPKGPRGFKSSSFRQVLKQQVSGELAEREGSGFENR